MSVAERVRGLRCCSLEQTAIQYDIDRVYTRWREEMKEMTLNSPEFA